MRSFPAQCHSFFNFHLLCQPQGQNLDEIVVSVPQTPAHGAVARLPSQVNKTLRQKHRQKRSWFCLTLLHVYFKFFSIFQLLITISADVQLIKKMLYLVGFKLADRGGGVQRRRLGSHEGRDGPRREESLVFPALLQRGHGAPPGNHVTQTNSTSSPPQSPDTQEVLIHLRFPAIWVEQF